MEQTLPTTKTEPAACRKLSFSAAINEAIDTCMAADPAVYIVGLGVPDPKGIFGTTAGLQTKYGGDRVLDMPASENAMTGVVLGSALAGMRPILVHQRLDFALLSVEQIVNQAAYWHYTYGGAYNGTSGGYTGVPVVIRMLVGRGWGQGPQHSQSLHSWFAHIPGLKVVLPTTAHDAKGLLIASIEDNNPVLFIEHRWLYNLTGVVPAQPYRIPLGQARLARQGKDVTIVSLSYMTIEALRAADMLAEKGISAEVIDLRSVSPLDFESISRSVKKTGRAVVADISWLTAGISAEIVARLAQENLSALKSAPVRIGLPAYPSPCSPALSKDYYPRAVDIAKAVAAQLGKNEIEFQDNTEIPLDIPDPSFTGPF